MTERFPPYYKLTSTSQTGDGAIVGTGSVGAKVVGDSVAGP